MTSYISKQLNKKEKPILLWILGASVLTLSFLYVYFLNSAIVSAVRKESLEKEIALASMDIGTLQSDYVKVQRNLTLDHALTIGFVEPKNIRYIGGQEGSLTFGKNI